MRELLLIVITYIPLLTTAQTNVLWTAGIDEDFSFTKNWHYPEGVFVNRHGQVSCDGLCPNEIYSMTDEEGKIFEDSLTSFYALVDTTHISETISCEARAYEFAGATETKCSSYDGMIRLETIPTIATHSTLTLFITVSETGEATLSAGINFNSIRPSSPVLFHCTSGTLQISKDDYANNLFKAKFDLVFESAPDDPEPLTWSGVICAPIVPIDI